jgi:hypothetical protein
MKTKLCRGALAALLFWAVPGMAAADELNLTIANGRVTLVAHDVTIRQILAEWARVGQTKIENGDKMMGPPVSLELKDVPESEALETVLRSAAGYMVAPRAAGRAGASSYDRIMILATSRPPAVSAMPQPTFNAPNNRPRPMPQPIMPDVTDEDAEPQNVAPGMQQFPGAAPEPGTQQFPQGQPPQGPLTAPRPGQLPQQPIVPGNPYRPGVRPPGMPAVPGVPPQPQQPTKPGGGGQ